VSDDQPVIEGTLDCDSRFFGVVVCPACVDRAVRASLDAGKEMGNE
jgi:hypothetical protein